MSPVNGWRQWQADALARMSTWSSGPFLVSAAPGAGKTRPALEQARRALSDPALESVVVVCPTSPLTRQWAEAASEAGLHLLPGAPSPVPPRGFHGVAVTYARIAHDPATWRQRAGSRFVVVDEAHHLGADLTWGSAFVDAFGADPRWLLLSGTPFRSDAMTIPGVRYSDAGVAVSDISYTYSDAVRDAVCRPMVFSLFDGQMEWRYGGVSHAARFDEDLVKSEHGRRYRTAIAAAPNAGLDHMLRAAAARLDGIRSGEEPAAGGLVVTADSEHAHETAARLRALTGHGATVVLHTDPGAGMKLEAFRTGTDPWVVAVNMISEGVDIPRLRVGVYATTAKTPMIFRQVVGRFTRVNRSSRPGPSWLYLPADPTLHGHVEKIEREIAMARKVNVKAPVSAEAADELVAEEPGEGEGLEIIGADLSAEQVVQTAAPSAAPTPSEVPAPSAPPWPVYDRLGWLRAMERRLEPTARAHARRSAPRSLRQVDKRAKSDGVDGVLKHEEAVERALRAIAPLVYVPAAGGREGPARG